MNQKIPQKIQTIKRKMGKKISKNQYQKNLDQSEDLEKNEKKKPEKDSDD
jgi:hypothetical protein